MSSYNLIHKLKKGSNPRITYCGLLTTKAMSSQIWEEITCSECKYLRAEEIKKEEAKIKGKHLVRHNKKETTEF